MRIGSTDVIVVALVEKIDEVHCFLGVAIEVDPFLEVEVLLFDLFDQRREEVLHFFLERVKLRHLAVLVFADNVLQLQPCHLLAIFVEQPAAAPLT
jgi:hypothetical protein